MKILAFTGSLKKRHLKQIIFIFVSFLWISCKAQDAQLPKSGFEEEVIILHANDIHSNIEYFPRFIYLVDSIKKLHKNVFLLSAGDLFTGNPYVDMYEDPGYPVIEFMNIAGFDLSAIGNHEFDLGQEILAKRIKQAKFPFICGNMQNSGGSLATPASFHQLKAGKLKINIFSLIDNSAKGLPESHPAKLAGLTFENGLEVAPKFKYLRKDANILIALTHLGIENDLELAKAMPEIDLIIGGHSHTVIDTAKLVNGVLVAQAGAKLRFLGEITLRLQNGKIIDKKGKLIPVRKNQKESQELREKVAGYSKNPYFDEVLGKAESDLKGSEELGSFITDAYRAYGNSDLAFQNTGGIRIWEIDSGNITRGLLFKLDPFGNGLVKLEMSLNEIKSLIKNSYKRNEIDLRISGAKYNLIIENNVVKDVLLTDYQDNPLDEKKTYKVSMNDYILNTYDFDHSDKGESLGIITSETLIEFLKKGPLKYSGIKRTFINGN